MEIIEEDILLDALSDLESDAEDVSHQEKMRYAKEAGLEKVSSKWMSRKKAWTSGEVSHCSVNRRRSRYLHVTVSVRGLEGSGESGCK